MANTFKLKTKLGTGGIAADAVQDVYTVPATTTSIIIGLTIANLKANAVTVDGIRNKSAVQSYISYLYGNDLKI